MLVRPLQSWVWQASQSLGKTPHTMRQTLPVIAAFAICATAFAQTGAAATCPTISDAAARLACYDNAFPPKISSAPGAAPASKSAPIGTAGAAANPDTFGLPQKAAALEPQAITSLVDEAFDGWGPNDKIRLHNGQVWEVMDGSSGTTTPAMRRVTVKRGALGSYFLEFEGLTKSPRVRRVK